MSENQKDGIKKKVDESWKDTVAKERSKEPPADEVMPEVTFSLFLSGLMMEALIALGDVEHPVTKKKELNVPHARFIIETLSMLKDKTKNNLLKDEEASFEAILYDLRMRFVQKHGK